MIIEALIFDVDGTMADTEEAHRVAFNLAFERFRLGWDWQPGEYRELLKVAGGKERIAHHIDTLPLDAGERRRMKALVPDVHAEKTRFYSAFVNDGAVPLREGVGRLIDEARSAGCRLAIASTTTAINIDRLLKAALGTSGKAMFDVIACGDEAEAKKPAPDIYRHALTRLQMPAARAVAVEDSLNGLRSATAAGLWTLITPNFWTEGSDFSAAPLVLPRLGEPDRPLPGEPGDRLLSAAWLTFDELTQQVARRPQRDAGTRRREPA
ncbi:MAG: HAD-IA family hydrolase [Caldimonas sp.]